MVVKGYIIAAAYAIVCLVLAAIAYKIGLPKKYTRKLVHILVGFEWVILYHFMGAGIHFLAVCVLFLLILAASYKFKMMPMISSDADNAPGTVYYAVAMCGVAAVGCFVPQIMLPFGIGVLCTSFGDGFAGVAGQLVKKRNPLIYANKTLVGTITNFVVSFASSYALSTIYAMGLTLPHCLAIAILATQLEILPKGGLDNIMITWGTTALAYGFMYLDCIEAYIIPILTTAPIIMFVCAKKALTKWGVVAAIALDVLVSVAFGNAGFVVLCAFLIGSIIIDKIKKHHKNQGRDEKEKKGDCRDFMQVLANGFACAIFAVVFLITRNNIFVIPFLAGIAEAFSDTAASGIGAFSEKTFDPFKWQKCEKGLSGGMSFVGTVASLAASVLIALLGFVCGMYYGIGEFLIISFCGFLGAIFDSFIGSLMQVKYKCSVCGSITEREEHCSVSAERYSGFIAFDNDVVNIVSSSFAALLALILIL